MERHEVDQLRTRLAHAVASSQVAYRHYVLMRADLNKRYPDPGKRFAVKRDSHDYRDARESWETSRKRVIELAAALTGEYAATTLLSQPLDPNVIHYK